MSRGRGVRLRFVPVLRGKELVSRRGQTAVPGGQHILHGSVDLGKLEDVAQFQRLARQDALPGRHHRRHLTEHQPQHEPRHRQEKLGLPDARPSAFEKALLLTGFGAVPFSGSDARASSNAQQDQPDEDPSMMNPAHHLPAAADRPADEQLERRQHLPQCPALAVEHHADPQQHQPHSVRLDRPRRFLPSDAELGEKIIAGPAALVDVSSPCGPYQPMAEALTSTFAAPVAVARVAAPAPARYAPCSERGYRAGVA